jgi:hypothetical protein
MRRIEAGEANAPPPTILHEYQNKRLTKFAIRKWLILKDAILVVSEGQENSQPQKKAGANSRTPDAFFPKLNCTKGVRNVKGNVVYFLGS